ncbi:MAG: SAM-dependent methyltransferase [Ruminococcaceae bacterium]|nr:SAM-dependent methyltransferase [Oscillospiraceae bacterium]
MTIELLDGERLDEVNEDISLIQKKDGLTFGTDAYLLAAFMKGGAKQRAVELGTGTGIISLLCASRKRFSHIDVFEVQEDFATLAQRNVSLNRLDEKMTVYQDDIRNVSANKLGYEIDVVFTNPPYMRTDSGKRNLSDYKYIARHEVCGGIFDFCAAADRLLKHGGKFYCVYRPDRLSELMWAMHENHLEPKRMTFVHADKLSEPSMVLIEAIKRGAAGMRVSAPIFLFEDGKRKPSEQAKKIYEGMEIEWNI